MENAGPGSGCSSDYRVLEVLDSNSSTTQHLVRRRIVVSPRVAWICICPKEKGGGGGREKEEEEGRGSAEPYTPSKCIQSFL